MVKQGARSPAEGEVSRFVSQRLEDMDYLQHLEGSMRTVTVRLHDFRYRALSQLAARLKLSPTTCATRLIEAALSEAWVSAGFDNEEFGAPWGGKSGGDGSDLAQDPEEDE